MKLEKRRWLLLAINVLINVCIGAGYAWSVFQNPLMKEFGWSTAATSLAFTLIMGVSALPMALVGKLQERFSPRVLLGAGGLLYGLCMFLTGYIHSLSGLYLLFGMGCGIGQGVIYATGTSNMVRLFPDKRGLCSGLLAAGMGSGAIILAPLAAMLIEANGPLVTFRMLGVVFTVLICGLSPFIITAPVDFLPPKWDPKRAAAALPAVEEKDWRGMLKSPLFYLIAGMFSAGTFSGMMIIGHASPLLQQNVSVNAQQAAVLVGFISLCNTGGRIVWGGLSDRVGRFRVVMILYLIIAASMACLSFTASAVLFVSAMLIVGMCYGGFMGLIASLTADAFGAKHLPVNFGIMFLAYGAASFAGPRLAAVVQGHNGSYTAAFMIAGAVSIAGIVLTILANRRMNGKASCILPANEL